MFCFQAQLRCGLLWCWLFHCEIVFIKTSTPSIIYHIPLYQPPHPLFILSLYTTLSIYLFYPFIPPYPFIYSIPLYHPIYLFILSLYITQYIYPIHSSQPIHCSSPIPLYHPIHLFIISIHPFIHSTDSLIEHIF